MVRFFIFYSLRCSDTRQQLFGVGSNMGVKGGVKRPNG